MLQIKKLNQAHFGYSYTQNSFLAITKYLVFGVTDPMYQLKRQHCYAPDQWFRRSQKIGDFTPKIVRFD